MFPMSVLQMQIHASVMGYFSSDPTLARSSASTLQSNLGLMLQVYALQLQMHKPVMGHFTNDPALAESSAQDLQSHLSLMFQVYVAHLVMGNISSDPTLVGSWTSDLQAHLGSMFYYKQKSCVSLLKALSFFLPSQLKAITGLRL